MELFKITCVTCNARLSVRNGELIGQIIACPRCDSMVQVEPPTEVPTPITPVTKTTIVNQARSEQNVDEPPEEDPPSELELASDSSAPLHATATAAKYKLAAWTVASFVVGATIGGIVFSLRGGAEVERVSASQPLDQVEQVEQDTTAIAAPETTLELPAASTPHPEPQLEEKPDSTLVENKAVEESGAHQREPPPPPKAQSSALESEVTVVDPPQVARKFDPLDLDPELMDFESLRGSDQQQSEPELSEELLPVDASPEPTVLPLVRRDPDDKRDRTPRPADKQLAQRFPAIEFRSLPLVDFLTLVSQLGGVPVSVSPEHLQMAGVTARQSVSLDAEDISLADVLEQTLKPLHLEYTTDGPQVVVVRQEAAKVRKIDYPLDDLLGAATSVEDITGWIEQFVVPTASLAVEGPAILETSDSSLQIEQVQQFQYRVLIFLERLRVARQLQPRSRFPVDRLAGIPAYAALAERLSSPTTFTFSHYTPLDEIFRFWQQELDTPILVDWPELAGLDLWPTTRVACAIEDKPWQDALDEVLEPLGVGWRAAPGRSIEISSIETLQTRPHLEIYGLGEETASNPDRIVSDVRRLTEAQSSLGGEPIAYAVAHDPVGNVLIVLGPAPAHRLIYQWLVDQEFLTSK